LTIYLGAHDITASYEANRRVYNGYEVYIHPEWNPSTQAGDIALIKLYNIVTYTRNYTNNNTGLFQTFKLIAEKDELNRIHPSGLPGILQRAELLQKLPLPNGVQLVTVLIQKEKSSLSI
jgi:hypothetical protein